jgi:hypothetical protein
LSNREEKVCPSNLDLSHPLKDSLWLVVLDTLLLAAGSFIKRNQFEEEKLPLILLRLRPGRKKKIMYDPLFLL